MELTTDSPDDPRPSFKTPTTTHMKRLLTTILALSLTAAAKPYTPDTMVLVVRHAEKAGPTGDVPLSPTGTQRALDLVAIARDAGVTAVITTQFQRTRQTGAPAADSLGIVAEVVSATADTKEHARQIADLVLSRHRGKTTLVVGHSNTVPAIVAALGGPSMRDLCDSVYDRLFAVSIDDAGRARTIATRYGAPTPADSTCSAMH